MARKSNNFSIFAEVLLDTSTIQKQLDKISREVKLDINDRNVKNTTDAVNSLTESLSQIQTGADEVSLTFQAANEIFSKSIQILGTMTEEVFKLDDSLTEFKKISDLSGDSLDRYTKNLARMGRQVARTGKPIGLSLYVGMINQHNEPL